MAREHRSRGRGLHRGRLHEFGAHVDIQTYRSRGFNR